MIEQSLDGAWQLRETHTDEWLPATVPGGVHLELMAAGRISDPFVGDEELRVQWVADREWEYRREFSVADDLAGAEHVELVCEGIDTFAALSLNGEPLGSADNMLRTWRWDVTGRLRHGGEANDLSAVFESATKKGAAAEADRYLISANDQLPGAPHLRKAPYEFGWDWGPKLPNVGFWRGVRLVGWSVARFDDVRISQSIEGDSAWIDATVKVERSDAPAGPLTVRITVEHPDGRTDQVDGAVSADQVDGQVSIGIEKPELWWPNGLGAQPLYRVEVELIDRESTLDHRDYRVGLRTVRLRREPDEWGESFQFVVNDVPIFAKGSNWIPADSFPSRSTPEIVTRLIEDAAKANHNMIRVWGGGYFESEAFFDACDRFGILVWHDLIFACSIYPLDMPEFVDNVHAEVIDNVRRIRHRACLAVWCGNNELEKGWLDWNWSRPPFEGLRAEYLRFFDHTLPDWIAGEDPATPYWPSSPSSGEPLVEKLSERQGDFHQWQVWHGMEPFVSYGRQNYRFTSEFGFESMPAMETIKAFAPDPTDWSLGSPVMDHHQRCVAGNAKIAYYMAEQFRLPRDFEGFVYLSQVLQAEAMRVGVEHWRRLRDRCGGALYWQLNDCWPVSSWSSIDYFGRWKALHYASKRFYSPILLSVEVAGDEARIWVTNDRNVRWKGQVRWSLETLDGDVRTGGSAPVVLGPVSSEIVMRVALPTDAADRRTVIVVADLDENELSGGQKHGPVVTPLVPDKHLVLHPARVTTKVEPAPYAPGTARVSLSSDSMARWVELRLEGADVIFSNNYLDLPPSRKVTVTFDLPEGWTIDQAREALRVRSVADTYLG